MCFGDRVVRSREAMRYKDTWGSGEHGGGMRMTLVEMDHAHARSLYLPAYTYADAGRYAETSPENVRRWFKGQTSGRRKMTSVFTAPPSDGLSYIQLIEVRFVAKMRKLEFTLKELRQARAYLRKALGVPYPFASEKFKHVGATLFI